MIIFDNTGRIHLVLWIVQKGASKYYVTIYERGRYQGRYWTDYIKGPEGVAVVFI